MNIFRFCGDAINTLSNLALLARLATSKNSQAISLRSLDLLVLVCITRYLDLFSTFYSWYNSCFKIFYLFASTTAVVGIRFYQPLKSTYDKSLDTFNHWKLAVAPCACLSVLITIILDHFLLVDYMGELLWRFSIFLEPFVLVPQLVLLLSYQEVESLTGGYIFGKSIYRSFYILNWIYRAHNERYYQHHPTVYVCGVLHSLVGAKVINLLYQKGWHPSGLLSLSTYTQPRLSRLRQQDDEKTVGGEDSIEKKGNRRGGFDEPLLVV